MIGEERILNAAWIGHGPCHIPRMLLDGLQDSALIRAYGIVFADISRLVDRPMKVVVEAPAIACALPFVVGVRLASVSSDAFQDLWRLVCAGEQIVQNIVARKRHGSAEPEPQPPEIGRNTLPLFHQLVLIDARMSTDIESVEILWRIVGDEVFEHHRGALFHRGILRPGSKV